MSLTSHHSMENSEGKGFFQKSLLYVCVVAIGTFSIGLVLTFYSPAYATITNELEFDQLEGSLFNALSAISATFGGPIINVVINLFGRKYPAMITQGVIIFGWILLIVTKRPYKGLCYAARIVMGLGAGAASTICPVYIAELSPLDQRGAYGVMSQFFLSIGSCLGYLLGIWCDWRVLNGICIVPAALMIILAFFIPESPAVKRIQDNEEKTQEKDTLFRMKYLKPMIISALTVIFQQFSGINAIASNLNPILIQSNISLDPSVGAVIVVAAQVVVIGGSSAVIKYLGVRWSWFASSLGQSIVLLLSWANEKWKWNNVLPVVLLFFDILFFGIGLGPLPWFICPELFPDSVRFLATSLIQGLNWLLCSVMMFAFQFMVDSMTLSWVYFFYAIFMVLSVLFAVFLLPETKGKEMGNIEDSEEDSEIAEKLKKNTEEIQ